MRIRSYSGDYFEIPKGQESEAQDYRDAVAKKDENKMLHFEEGETGWTYCSAP